MPWPPHRSPLARRAVRRWLTEDHPPDAATVERVLAVARGEAIATDIGGGRRVDRHQQRLSVLHPWAARVATSNLTAHSLPTLEEG